MPRGREVFRRRDGPLDLCVSMYVVYYPRLIPVYLDSIEDSCESAHSHCHVLLFSVLCFFVSRFLVWSHQTLSYQITRVAT
jgi:hypothetical protein